MKNTFSRMKRKKRPMLTVLHELAEDFSTGPLLILAFRANTSLLLFPAGRFFPPDANKKHAESLRALRTLLQIKEPILFGAIQSYLEQFRLPLGSWIDFTFYRTTIKKQVLFSRRVVRAFCAIAKKRFLLSVV